MERATTSAAARSSTLVPDRFTATQAPQRSDEEGWSPSAEERPRQLRPRRARRARAHPHRRPPRAAPFGPAALARALGRSSGAVQNYLERLAGRGEVTRMGARPPLRPEGRGEPRLGPLGRRARASTPREQHQRARQRLGGHGMGDVEVTLRRSWSPAPRARTSTASSAPFGRLARSLDLPQGVGPGGRRQVRGQGPAALDPEAQTGPGDQSQDRRWRSQQSPPGEWRGRVTRERRHPWLPRWRRGHGSFWPAD